MHPHSSNESITTGTTNNHRFWPWTNTRGTSPWVFFDYIFFGHLHVFVWWLWGVLMFQVRIFSKWTRMTPRTTRTVHRKHLFERWVFQNIKDHARSTGARQGGRGTSCYGPDRELGGCGQPMELCGGVHTAQRQIPTENPIEFCTLVIGLCHCQCKYTMNITLPLPAMSGQGKGGKGGEGLIWPGDPTPLS